MATMPKVRTFELAITTLIRAASSPGFRDVEGAREFFRCSDMDELLEVVKFIS